MLNVYLDYVQSLAELNSSIVTPGIMPEPSVLNAFAWGFVEELEEYAEAKAEQKIKEAGDVLAYTTLLLLCAAEVQDVAEVLCYWCKGGFTGLSFFSNMKRINRENQSIDWANVLCGWTDVLRNAGNLHSLTFADIAEANISKLKDRAERKVMFSGSGDDR
jgi:hypothetical protein